jgi:hypothetical protein
MSHFDTKQAFINQLSTIVNLSDVAFENKNFNPTGKSLWYAAYYIPATTEATGKTLSSSDEQRGIFQVSVFCSANSSTYDNEQLQAIDNVLTAFRYNQQLVYNNQTVSTLDSNVNSGIESESWFKRDISINYLTFSTK